MLAVLRKHYFKNFTEILNIFAPELLEYFDEMFMTCDRLNDGVDAKI